MLVLAATAVGAVGVSPASAAEHLSASRSDALMCPITTDAVVYREAYEVRGRTRYRAVVRTATVIGFNEYVFVGCRINVKVNLRIGGAVIRTVEHSALAGARWDPWGNKKWYTWYDEIPIEDLEDADNLEILHEQQ
jgi:hypothetical protein